MSRKSRLRPLTKPIKLRPFHSFSNQRSIENSAELSISSWSTRSTWPNAPVAWYPPAEEA